MFKFSLVPQNQKFFRGLREAVKNRVGYPAGKAFRQGGVYALDHPRCPGDKVGDVFFDRCAQSDLVRGGKPVPGLYFRPPVMSIFPRYRHCHQCLFRGQLVFTVSEDRVS